MAFILDDRVRQTTTTTGTGPIALGTTPGGYQPFSNVMNVGDTTLYAFVMPGGGWETGKGTYTALNTLDRTTVISSSNAGALVSFPVGSKDCFITQPAKQAAQGFPSGTLMLFQQSAAPIYWTKKTTHDDKALRVVSGTASFGGINQFSAVMAQTTVQNTTINTGSMPSHNHSVTAPGAITGTGTGATIAMSSPFSGTTGTLGGDGPHTHAIGLNITYVDVILASKD